MAELIIKLRILFRTELALFKAETNRKTNILLLTSIAIGALFIAIIFVNIGLFFTFSNSDIDAKAAYWIALINLIIAVIPFILAKQLKASPEELMVQDMRDMTLDEIMKDAQSITKEVESIKSNIKDVKNNLTSFGKNSSLASISTLLPIVIDLLKKK